MTIPLDFGLTPLPATPTGLQATRQRANNIMVRWNKSEDVYHKFYNLERSDDSGTTWYTIASPRTRTYHEDKDLPATTYLYKLKDVDTFEIDSEYTSNISLTIAELDPALATLNLTAGVAQIIDISSVLGRTGTEGFILNKGPGNVIVEFSADGTNYTDDSTTLGVDDSINIGSSQERFEVSKVRYTSDTNDTILTHSII